MTCTSALLGKRLLLDGVFPIRLVHTVQCPFSVVKSLTQKRVFANFTPCCLPTWLTFTIPHSYKVIGSLPENRLLAGATSCCLPTWLSLSVLRSYKVIGSGLPQERVFSGATPCWYTKWLTLTVRRFYSDLKWSSSKASFRLNHTLLVHQSAGHAGQPPDSARRVRRWWGQPQLPGSCPGGCWLGTAGRGWSPSAGLPPQTR